MSKIALGSMARTILIYHTWKRIPRLSGPLTTPWPEHGWACSAASAASTAPCPS